MLDSPYIQLKNEFALRRSVFQEWIPHNNQATAHMQHHKPQLDDAFLTRREFLSRCGMGMGALSLATLFGGAEAISSTARAEGGYMSPLVPKQPQFPAKT